MPSKHPSQGGETIADRVQACSEVTKKSQRMHTVVVHNQMTTTPQTDDWILYPDNSVVVKHSTIRDRKAQKVCLATHRGSNICNGSTTRPMMLPTPPGSDPAKHGHDKRADNGNAARGQALRDLRGEPTFGQLDPPATNARKSRERSMHPHRLATPDISDVDEDEFWSCCDAGGRKA